MGFQLFSTSFCEQFFGFCPRSFSFFSFVFRLYCPGSNGLISTLQLLEDKHAPVKDNTGACKRVCDGCVLKAIEAPLAAEVIDSDIEVAAATRQNGGMQGSHVFDSIKC